MSTIVERWYMTSPGCRTSATLALTALRSTAYTSAVAAPIALNMASCHTTSPPGARSSRAASASSPHSSSSYASRGGAASSSRIQSTPDSSSSAPSRSSARMRWRDARGDTPWPQSPRTTTSCMAPRMYAPSWLMTCSLSSSSTKLAHVRSICSSSIWNVTSSSLRLRCLTASITAFGTLRTSGPLPNAWPSATTSRSPTPDAGPPSTVVARPAMPPEPRYTDTVVLPVCISARTTPLMTTKIPGGSRGAPTASSAPQMVSPRLCMRMVLLVRIHSMRRGEQSRSHGRLPKISFTLCARHCGPRLHTTCVRRSTTWPSRLAVRSSIMPPLVISSTNVRAWLSSVTVARNVWMAWNVSGTSMRRSTTKCHAASAAWDTSANTASPAAPEYSSHCVCRLSVSDTHSSTATSSDIIVR
mmetsp:Transcript_40723/g.121471  ORF Transcript_40723/g.121471 Transcript_40723/m.121471 type:complete len:415 (-) Transcript_40723:536-1780(-)